jgi:hypothetical protein
MLRRFKFMLCIIPEIPAKVLEPHVGQAILPAAAFQAAF